MTKLREFVSLYRLYHKHHSASYAARRAYDMAFRGLPF
jgi:hypothetical protein